jgi:phenylacetate-CoA ligase
MLNMCEEFLRQGIDPQASSLKIGIFGAEPWTEAMRAEIEQRLDIDAIDLYGLSEVIGPGVACECFEAKDGPVIWEDHFLPEIINPETGEALPDGEIGELVFTSLTKEALPVIRYRTRDRTRLLPPTARSMRRMAKVTGRTDDMLIIRGVNVFPSQIEELIIGHTHLAPHYLLEVRRDGALDHLDVKVELDRGAPNLADIRDEAARDLQRRIKSYVGVTASVTVCNPMEIERSVGKAKRVVDRRASEQPTGRA